MCPTLQAINDVTGAKSINPFIARFPDRINMIRVHPYKLQIMHSTYVAYFGHPKQLSCHAAVLYWASKSNLQFSKVCAMHVFHHSLPKLRLTVSTN